MADDDRPGAAPPPPEEPKPAAPPPADDTSKDKDADPGKEKSGDKEPPTGRDEAVQNLRTEAPELANLRFGEIIAEGASRLAGANTFNVYQGDFFIDGDFVATGTGRRRAGGGRTARETIDLDAVLREQDHFVPPPDFEAGVDLLLDKHVLILSGPANTGLRCRAQATLLAALARSELEPRLAPVTSAALGNASWRVPSPSTGLLVMDRAGKGGKFAAEAVTDTWLAAVSVRLAEQESFLVVVTGPVAGALATASRRGEFVLDDLELPDMVEIVRRRVHNELAWDLADLDERLAETELAEILAERDSLRFAVRAAQVVMDALRDGADLVAAVAGLRDAQGEVREWLSREPDLMQIAFVMATAVLEGASYLSVADAAVHLYRELSGSNGVTTPRYQRELRLERNWIKWAPGADGGRTVRFKHAGLRQEVLAVIWFEYDGARSAIVGWLKDLVDDTDVEVRARAAQAAGILARNDFTHGMHLYLGSWAADGSPRLRQSAATGLNIAGAARDYVGVAWTYIENWAELVAGPANARINLQRTAALAAGRDLGVASPHRALRMLRTLVSKGDWALLEAVAISTQALIEAGRAPEVVEALLDWTDASPSDEVVERALLIFAYTVWAGSDASQKPLLLLEAEDYRDELPELWGRALTAELSRQLAIDALESWVRLVDSDPSLRATVLDVLAGIADHRPPRTYDRLCRLLREWATDPDDPSEAAREFHNELLDAGEEAS